MYTLSISSHKRSSLIDITKDIQEAIRAHSWQSGALVLFCPHTTCGLTINEGADPDVALDINAFLNKLIPQDPNFRHYEGNSDAHIKASFFGSSLHLIVENGKLCLGTWQTIYLFDGDGPRKRSVWLQWLSM